MDPYPSGVPPPVRHELRREHLLELLHKHRARPLAMLVAPAGFGKSTLAATYARDSGAAVAWLTLRSADRDPRLLFSRLADAFCVAFDDGSSVAELRKGLADGADGVGLARLLLNDLGSAPSGFILVLDDFDLVGHAEDVVGAIDALIRELPEGGQIVITARRAPALSMTRLVVEGSVFPLGIEDLRFSQEETRALRVLRGGGDADDDARDQLAEGWVAGILLGGAPRELGLGGGSLVSAYVEREVLGRLTTEERHWIEMLSVFDSIKPRIAERVLGAGPWPSRLESLVERCPFLAPQQDGSYRLHGLVRETVNNRLRRSPDDRWTQAWTIARDLAEETFDTVGLVRACQELGELDGAVELVRRTANDAVQSGRWAAVLVTLELLPESVRRAHPDLSLVEARALLNTGHPEYAHHAAEAVLQHGGRSGDASVQVRAIVELATVTFSSDVTAAEDYLLAADHLLRNSQFPPAERRLLEGRALAMRGVCAAVRGDTAEARSCFESGERLLKLLGPSRDLALVQQNRGSFCTRVGEYGAAQEALAAAASHWRLMGDRNGLAGSQILLGDLHLRLGKLEAAGAELNDALAAARAIGALRMEAHATASLGQWHRANGRLTEAVAQFDEGIRQAGEIVERELLAEVLVWRAEVALLQADLETARHLLARAQAEAQRIGANPTLATVDRALGRLHLSEAAGTRAVEHLEAALERAGDGWGADQRAQTLYWIGAAYLQLGHAQKAGRHLEQAIGIVEDASIAAFLAGPASEDARLLEHGRMLGLNPVLLAEVERLSATRRPWTGVKSPSISIITHNDLPRLDVQLFGSFVLLRNGELIGKASRKVDRATELAALLILYPTGLPDATIADMMFPDMPPEGALHNLQMAAYSLRKDLGSKAAVRYGARTYQLAPQLELVADVREFDAAIARARGRIGAPLIAALSAAVGLYRDPLLADAAWAWLDPIRLQYRARYVSAAVQLTDAWSQTDPAGSDALSEQILAVAPETDVAYERLILNARRRQDISAVRRFVKRYQQAAAQYDFRANPLFTTSSGDTSSPRAAR